MWLPVIVVVLTVFNYISPKVQFNPFTGHTILESGFRGDEDVLSYEYKGFIPLFSRNYRVLVKPQRQDVEGNFTYLRVEYINKVTTVLAFYNVTTQWLIFRVKYPFIRTPFNVTGYSKLKHVNTTTRTSFNWNVSNLFDLIKSLMW